MADARIGIRIQGLYAGPAGIAKLLAHLVIQLHQVEHRIHHDLGESHHNVVHALPAKMILQKPFGFHLGKTEKKWIRRIKVRKIEPDYVLRRQVQLQRAGL